MILAFYNLLKKITDTLNHVYSTVYEQKWARWIHFHISTITIRNDFINFSTIDASFNFTIEFVSSSCFSFFFLLESLSIYEIIRVYYFYFLPPPTVPVALYHAFTNSTISCSHVDQPPFYTENFAHRSIIFSSSFPPLK